MSYWDASALLPVLREEASSEDVRRVLASQSETRSLGTVRVEVACAIARWERGSEVSPILASVYRREAQNLLDEFVLVWPSEALVAHAWDLARIHPLRAGDALHLAAWRLLAAGNPSALPFVCLDKRLCEAALAEGATVLP